MTIYDASRAADEPDRFFIALAAVTRILRAPENLSRTDVARRAGISRTLVSDIEHQRANPTTIQLDKLARGLGLAGADKLIALAEETADRIAAGTIRAAD